MRIPTFFTTSIQHSAGSSIQSNWTRKRKSIQIGNEEVNLFTGGMMLHVENSEDHKKLLELMNEFCKVAEY